MIHRTKEKMIHRTISLDSPSDPPLESSTPTSSVSGLGVGFLRTGTEVDNRRGPGPILLSENAQASAAKSGADAKTGDLTAEDAFHAVFWPAYPRKIAKHAALLAWKSLKLKDDDQATLDHIMRGLAHYVANEWESDQPRFITHASTWLHQRRWQDVE